MESRAWGERRPATDAEARALASAVRLRILRLCLDRPLSNREIALRLDRNPASVLHHVRTLVETGFLVAEEPRRGARGAREVPYRASGRSWQLDFSGAPVADRDPVLGAFLGEVAAVGERELRSTRLGLRLTPEHREEFLDELYGLLDRWAHRSPDEGGERWSVYLGVHPEG